ncbi:MAG: hypothetical protein ACTSQK_10300 [Candidatus Heimdallarchaeota archaeon]
MAEHIINDDWVLKRVSKGSSSFNDWIQGLVSQIQKSIDTKYPEDSEEFKEGQKGLTELVDLELKLEQGKKSLSKASEKIQGLGAIGNYISSITSNLGTKISQQLQNVTGGSEYIGSNGLKIDFLTGKRKSLASALHDVAVEKGIKSEGILYLIKSLPDFESFLYSTSAGKFYRDHTEHQLRVAVLGDFLLEQDFGVGTLVKHIADLSEIDESDLKNNLWWTMGLLHDIGYPLQKMTESINYSLLNQILKCYPMLDLEVVPFEITLSMKEKKQKEYLSFLEEGLSKEAIKLIRLGAGIDFNSVPVPKSQLFTSNPNGHSEFKYESPVNLDHGVIGALAILKGLGTPEEIRENKDENAGFIKAAQAIALHNFKNKLPDYTFDHNPLAFLLVLVDELQEWGRPIPLQIRDSYFTTELKKITLLDEIKLTIDEVQWLMEYRKIDAKKLTNFQFQLFCQGKNKALGRLSKGKEFPETRIVIQDYEMTEQPNEMTPEKSLESLTSQVVHKESKKSLSHRRKTKERLKQKIKEGNKEEQAIAINKLRELSITNDSKNDKPRKIEQLLAEFYIVI